MLNFLVKRNTLCCTVESDHHLISFSTGNFQLVILQKNLDIETTAKKFN